MAQELSAGSLTADGSEQTIATRTTIGNYQLMVDLNAMANGDVVVLRAKARARAADSTDRLIYLGTFANAQAVPIVATVPICATYCSFTLEQTAGTYRAFPWGLHSL